MTGSRLVVVGDALLDVDVTGSSSRLAPDAPVPVVDVAHRSTRPGGAGLAAVLAARSGARVRLVAAVGDDDAGHELRMLLADEGVELLPLPMAGTTPSKTRVGAVGHPLLRLDEGCGVLDSAPLGERGAAVLAALESADAVLVSDYGRGVSQHRDIRAMVAHCAAWRPVVWDPHPRGAAPVPGTWVATPNLDEARHVLRGDSTRDGASSWAAVVDLARSLAREWNDVRAVCVTAGERGAVLSYGGDEPAVVPTRTRAVGDTCGAGDQFAAALALGLADGRVITEAVEAAVSAAGAYIVAGGAAAVQAPPPEAATEDAGSVVARTRRAGGTVVATGGCFDLLHSGHVATLSAARAMGDCLVVLLNSDTSVRALKGCGRPLVPQEDRARVLLELASVDAVAVFDDLRPDRLLADLRPDIWVKGGDYASADLPERDVLAGWGGRVVTVPYVPGRSTSALVRAARMEGAT